MTNTQMGHFRTAYVLIRANGYARASEDRAFRAGLRTLEKLGYLVRTGDKPIYRLTSKGHEMIRFHGMDK